MKLVPWKLISGAASSFILHDGVRPQLMQILEMLCWKLQATGHFDQISKIKSTQILLTCIMILETDCF